MGVIVYELNEVPVRLFEFYARSHPSSAFNTILSRGIKYKTKSADIGELSPWITWPTMHRGVSNVDHEISDLGQDLNNVNKDFPNVYEMLAQKGFKVGVFGSLQSYPLPMDLDNYTFYVPDTFAAGDECYPSVLSAFQKFNLSMVRSSGRNVSAQLAIKDASEFLTNSFKLGLTPHLFASLFRQLIGEKFNRDVLVRRRTSQAEIAFDLYYHQLIKTNPDISFFFTNHVASSMHRYWPTIFPADYAEGKFDKQWLERWRGEIPHAVRVANYQLGKLIKLCDLKGSELIVSSSMGQAAVENVNPVERQILITNLNKFMNYLGIMRDEWEPKLAMAPLIVFRPKSEIVFEKLKKLERITINDRKLSWSLTSTGEIRLSSGIYNQDLLVVRDNGMVVDPDNIGISNIHLQDASGAYAYHIPEGILLKYDPKLPPENVKNEEWLNVSALDFAPSILNKFNQKLPSYMKGDNLFL